MKYLDLTQSIAQCVIFTTGTETVDNSRSILKQKVNAVLPRRDQDHFFPHSFKFIIYQSTIQTTHYNVMVVTTPIT